MLNPYCDYDDDYWPPPPPRRTPPARSDMPRLANSPIEGMVMQLGWDLPDNWIESLTRFRQTGLHEATLGWLVAVTASRKDLSPYDHWRYFCGCCWHTIRGTR